MYHGIVLYVLSSGYTGDCYPFYRHLLAVKNSNNNNDCGDQGTSEIPIFCTPHLYTFITCTCAIKRLSGTRYSNIKPRQYNDLIYTIPSV